MILLINLMETDLLLFLGEISGLVFIIILLILFLINKNKSKKIFVKNQILESEIKELKKELNNKNKSLEAEIALKTKELLNEIENRKAIETERKIALKKAEEASFLKNAFLANMSHEIRTPLNGIIGFSHLLLSEVEYQEKPELVDFAKGIAESSDRLLNLMEHIIDLSRIDANDYEIKIKTFEINAVVKVCVEKIKNTAFKNGLIFKYEQDSIYLVKGDTAAFEKSVDLLLDNALKYTIEGNISVSIKADIDKNIVIVSISDTGIGIDKNFLSSIFEAFRQESTGYSRIHQGAGLGLPLAQKLMLLMGGEIKIKSEKGKGTEVSIILPLDNSQDQTSLKYDKKKLDNQKIKTKPNIFIVEDDKMNRMVFEKMLSKYANVKIAVDGDDAFIQLEKAILSKSTFDIILLDINLPKPWDGMLLLTELKKKWPELNKIPFIAQTAYAMTGDKEKFLKAGFDDYISKPIDKKELFTIIENNMRKFRTSKF